MSTADFQRFPPCYSAGIYFGNTHNGCAKLRIFRKKCGAGSWKFQQALQPHMERFLIICKARRAQSVPLSAKTLFPCLFLVTGLSVQQANCMVIDGGWILKNPYSQPRVRPFQLRFKNNRTLKLKCFGRRRASAGNIINYRLTCANFLGKNFFLGQVLQHHNKRA